MKIIALEEHTVDRTIGAATAEVCKNNVPYLDTFYRADMPATPTADSLFKMGDYRLADMDRCGIMTLCNVPDDIAFPVRLGGHVLCGIWITVVCMFCSDRLLKYLGFFIASWLAVFSFFGGVLDMSLLAVPGVLVVVWLALLGWRYKI